MSCFCPYLVAVVISNTQSLRGAASWAFRCGVPGKIISSSSLTSRTSFRPSSRRIENVSILLLLCLGKCSLFVSNFWLGFWSDDKSSFRSYVLSYCLKARVSIVRKTMVRNHRRVEPDHRARNSSFFGSDKCHKHSLCERGCCNDFCSLDTSKGGGMRKFVTRRARSGQ